jgi:HSP20 family protein
MELVSKLKEMIPWRRKPVDTHEVLSLRDDVNRVFDRFFDRFLLSPFDVGREWPFSGKAWSYGTDLDETEDEVVVRMDVPGLDPKWLEVSVRDGMLQMRYERKNEWREKNGDAGWSRYGAFSRSIALPDGLETSRAQATCKHGVLVVRIPKSEEAKSRTRRITVSIE